MKSTTTWNIVERGAAATKGKPHAPCSISAISPLASVISLPGVASVTPETGSLRIFLNNVTVRVFLTKRPKRIVRLKVVDQRRGAKKQQKRTEMSSTKL